MAPNVTPATKIKNRPGALTKKGGPAMKTAAIYARFSSDLQREESIDAQFRAIEEYAQNNNISYEEVLYLHRLNMSVHSCKP